jgi:carboxyl-terminal processing protease
MKLRTIVAAMLVLGLGCTTSIAKPRLVELAELKPTATQAEAATWTMRYLSRIHYRSQRLDDKLSSQIFDGYVDSLDGERWFLLASDLAALEQYRNELDDAILEGELDAPFVIFKRYLERVAERTTYARGLLKEGFDFTLDEEYAFDREDEDFAADPAQLDELWRQRVKNDWLRLILAGKEDKDIRETLDKRYADFQVRVEQLDGDDIFQTFLNAYASAIEPHTSYLGPRASENFAISMRLSLEGIGAVLQREGEYTVVRQIVPGGPLDRDGRIKAGDRIISVGTEEAETLTDVIGWRLDDVVDLIRGPKGTKVRLEVLPKSAGVDAPSERFLIARDKVALEQQAAKQRILEVQVDDELKRIGVIELPTFYMDFAARSQGDRNYRSSTRDVSKLLAELKEAKVDGIVIDLRNNGGGSLAESTELTGLFIDRGPVVQVRDGAGRTQIERDTQAGVVYDGPLAVLVNRASASASEIFAAAIQDYGRGLVIGETTFGKGTVQNLVDLDHVADSEEPALGQLKMTIAQFFRVNGKSTQHRGVVPDVAFPNSVGSEEYGESSFENALPYTEIAALDYTPSSKLSQLSDALSTRHLGRASTDEELRLYFEEIEEYRVEREKRTVSLNLAKRKTERAEQEQREAARAERLAAIDAAYKENRPQLDDGLNPGEAGSRYSEVDEDEDNDRPDVLLTEAARVLGDAIAIGGSVLTAQLIDDKAADSATR